MASLGETAEISMNSDNQTTSIFGGQAQLVTHI